jgi:hypothetical protein
MAMPVAVSVAKPVFAVLLDSRFVSRGSTRWRTDVAATLDDGVVETLDDGTVGGYGLGEVLAKAGTINTASAASANIDINAARRIRAAESKTTAHTPPIFRAQTPVCIAKLLHHACDRHSHLYGFATFGQSGHGCH